MAKRVLHPWKFFSAGGVDQVVLATGADIAGLRHLDQKLWVALACPVKGTELDEKTLSFIDSNEDGRVRVPEILSAISWLGRVLKDLDVLFEAGDAIAFTNFCTTTKDGKSVLASARHILAEHGKKDSKEITLNDVLAMEELFVATRFNGDGIVPADSAEDDTVRVAIEEVITAVGSVKDRSGKPGVDQKLLDGFFAQADAVLAWDEAGQAEGLKVLGEATAAAGEALTAVQAKLDDYFTRCRIAAYDARATPVLNATEADYQALAPKALTLSDSDVAKLPIAKIANGQPLPLASGLNPAWTERVARFVGVAITPLLGPRTALSEEDYGKVVAQLAAFCAWQAKQPTGPVASLGLPRLRELTKGGLKAKIESLIAQDAALESEYAAMAAVEKAIRLRRDLLTILRNFVNFADFYARKGGAFQAGTLYLDGRACDLVVHVNDPAKHAALAGLSKTYLAYCDCSRGTESLNVVAAFTAGDVDHLMVGRNGVFYDRQGRDWDARITNIIENPISIRQAFWSPYKRLVRQIEEQAARRAAEKEKASSAGIDHMAATAVAADKTPAAGAAGAAAGAPGAGGSKKMDIGVVAAIGVAVAGLATFLSSILTLFLGLGFWIPLAIIAVPLAISAPSMLIAGLKLRQRNLGPILDANGWAINGRVRVNIPLGGSLTSVARLPEGATRELSDPFADKPSRWWIWVLLLLIVGAAGALWKYGYLSFLF